MRKRILVLLVIAIYLKKDENRSSTFDYINN